MEAFCDGHVAAFAFFGGVPQSILYDNTRLAVAKILGDGTRLRSRMFSALQSHYLFEDRFGRPGKGNDKGKVEGMVGYAQTAHERGIKVIIAGAGGAAHLPGMVAALTPLPVVGVPVTSRQLQGLDSLYSIVQMPRGIPVATVAIGNATNAGLLAVQILAAQQPLLLAAVQDYRAQLKAQVQDKQTRLREIGYQAYLEEMRPQ